MSIGDVGAIAQDTDSVLGTILLSRGWQSIDEDRAWEWRPPGRTGGPHLFAAGACVLIDDSSGDYVVEGPAAVDRPAGALRYRSRRDLLDRLESIEAWTFPRTAADLDAEHTEALGLMAGLPEAPGLVPSSPRSSAW